MVYLLDTDEFSTFERRLNDVVSQVFEVSEYPQLFLPDNPKTTRDGHH